MLSFSGVPPACVKQISGYCHQLLTINDSNVVSLYLMKDDDFSKDIHLPKKLLVILNELESYSLKKNLKLVHSGIKKDIPAPLFLTTAHMTSSCDVFPLDFLEMQRRNMLLYGDDYLSTLTVDNANLRLVCEQEIKGKLIRLRQVYLENGLKEKKIKTLIHQSFQAFVKVLRGMLTLKNEPIPESTPEVFQRFSEQYGMNVDILKVIYNVEVSALKGAKLEDFFALYLDTLQRLAILIDEYQV